MTSRLPYRRIGVMEARYLAGRDDVLIFDVRDKDAYDAGHIAGAQHITIHTLVPTCMSLPKGRPILIYCYHGYASQEYAMTIHELGFSAVCSMDGGFEAWVQAELPVTVTGVSHSLNAWLDTLGFTKLNSIIANNTTPLMKACHLGEVRLAEEIIAGGADLNARNADGNNALWLACVGNSPEAMTLLIEAGIDTDNMNDNGATVLMYAASSGKAWAVELLLAAGADTAAQSLDGFTALDMAATAECLYLLLRPAASSRPAPAAKPA